MAKKPDDEVLRAIIARLEGVEQTLQIIEQNNKMAEAKKAYEKCKEALAPAPESPTCIPLVCAKCGRTDKWTVYWEREKLPSIVKSWSDYANSVGFRVPEHVFVEAGIPERLVWECECGYTIETKTWEATHGKE